MIAPSVMTSRASAASRQPKLRMAASSAARSVMFRNTTSATASTQCGRRGGRDVIDAPDLDRDGVAEQRSGDLPAVGDGDRGQHGQRGDADGQADHPDRGAARSAGHVQRGQGGDAAGVGRAAGRRHRRSEPAS